MITDGIQQLRRSAEHYRAKAEAIQADIERIEYRYGDYDAMPPLVLEVLKDARVSHENYRATVKAIEHDLDYPARAAEVIAELESMLAATG